MRLPRNHNHFLFGHLVCLLSGGPTLTERVVAIKPILTDIEPQASTSVGEETYTIFVIPNSWPSLPTIEELARYDFDSPAIVNEPKNSNKKPGGFFVDKKVRPPKNIKPRKFVRGNGHFRIQQRR